MKTKFTIQCTLVSIVAILLIGCSSEAAGTVSESNDLSTAVRLALGVLKLEGTDQAVTKEEATELLPLWQVYQSLSNSDTTSHVELDALMKQIQGAMTAEQIKAIEALELTDESVNEVMQTLGGSASASAPSSTPNTSALNQTTPMGRPAGMPGGAGDSIMNEIGNGMVTQSTPLASQPAASTQTSQVDGMLLNMLIQMLEARSQMIG